MSEKELLRKLKREVKVLRRALSNISSTISFIDGRDIEETLLWYLDDAYKALNKLNKTIKQLNRNLTKA